MRAFIVRPFGVQEGIDFDLVQKHLIDPALAELRALGTDVDGGTTETISKQGNIREDMFRLLAVSDLVIADVSIHNANAFYELGVRHALCAGHTFLIRSKTDDKYPFDLQTDRYFLYDVQSIQDAAQNTAVGSTANDLQIRNLAQALRATLDAPPPDSPIFQLLSGLEPHGRRDLVKIPPTFKEDVERARRSAECGALRLFATEVPAFEWDQEGLRLIGDAQFRLRDFSGAREAFELLRKAAPNDVPVNFKLATVYQRLALDSTPLQRIDLLGKSDECVQRALDASTTPSERAEALALQGSNEKSHWIDEYRAAAPGQRAATALVSPHFAKMLTSYLDAYNLDLNAHYPGVNALNLLRAQVALAKNQPKAWKSKFATAAEAARQLKAREQLASRLASSLCLALELDDVMGKRKGSPVDRWAISSCADHALTTLMENAERVTEVYRQATADIDHFTLESMRRSLSVFEELGLFSPSLEAAIAVIDHAIAANNPVVASPERVLLFSGHLVDAPGRPKEKERFPNTAKAEATARRLIEEAVKQEMANHSGSFVGIAGGASGGDILFHEVCERLGVPTQLYLALPRDQFRIASVQAAGPRWIDRYEALCDRVEPHVLQSSKYLPAWLASKPDYNVWQRSNLWMLFSALASGASRRTLIALYNPERESDGAGGTGDFVAIAARHGIKTVALDARELLME